MVEQGDESAEGAGFGSKGWLLLGRSMTNEERSSAVVGCKGKRIECKG